MLTRDRILAIDDSAFAVPTPTAPLDVGVIMPPFGFGCAMKHIGCEVLGSKPHPEAKIALH